MTWQYVLCIVFTANNNNKSVKIITLMHYGTIECTKKDNAEEKFDVDEAISDFLKTDEAIEILKTGASYFSATHIILPQMLL